MTNHFLLKIIITLFNYARCMKLAHVIYLLCIQSSKAMLLVSIPRSERGSYIWRCNFYAIYMKSVTTNTTIIWRLHWPSFVVRGGCKSIIGYATGIKHNQRTCDVKNHHSSALIIKIVPPCHGFGTTTLKSHLDILTLGTTLIHLKSF
jgi:hypothetical protein